MFSRFASFLVNAGRRSVFRPLLADVCLRFADLRAPDPAVVYRHDLRDNSGWDHTDFTIIHCVILAKLLHGLKGGAMRFAQCKRKLAIVLFLFVLLSFFLSLLFCLLVYRQF
jgi:hypothetical protein